MLIIQVTLVFVLLLHVAWAVDSDVTKFMRHLKVIPDVIDDGPKVFLKITYDSGVMADKGVELKASQVKNPPKLKWNSSASVFYTLIMTDPDASEAKMRSEKLHWLVVNIPGQDLNKGQVLSKYIGSGPAQNTGLHRYVFLLYKQPTKLDFDEWKNEEAPRNFSTKKFVARYKLGVPEAGNFYQAQWGDDVSELYTKIKLKL